MVKKRRGRRRRGFDGRVPPQSTASGAPPGKGREIVSSTGEFTRPMVGWRGQLAREGLRLSREELAKRLSAVTGEPWTAGRVRRLELGAIALSDEVLEYLSEAAGAEPEWFLGPS